MSFGPSRSRAPELLVRLVRRSRLSGRCSSRRSGCGPGFCLDQPPVVVVRIPRASCFASTSSSPAWNGKVDVLAHLVQTDATASMMLIAHVVRMGRQKPDPFDPIDARSPSLQQVSQIGSARAGRGRTSPRSGPAASPLSRPAAANSCVSLTMSSTVRLTSLPRL